MLTLTKQRQLFGLYYNNIMVQIYNLKSPLKPLNNFFSLCLELHPAVAKNATKYTHMETDIVKHY